MCMPFSCRWWMLMPTRSTRVPPAPGPRFPASRRVRLVHACARDLPGQDTEGDARLASGSPDGGPHRCGRAPDQNGLEARGARSSMASRILTRMSVALQRSNAIILPARCQRELTGPLQAPSRVEETRFGVLACWRGRGRAMPGDAAVAAA